MPTSALIQLLQHHRQICTLKQCGMVEHEIGITYVADHMQANQVISLSALDHVYSSSQMSDHTKSRTLANASSDHVPVITSFKSNQKSHIHISKITKRSQKFFTKERWNECLAKKNWSKLEMCENVDQMVEIFTEKITEALDEITPLKSVTIAKLMHNV